MHYGDRAFDGDRMTPPSKTSFKRWLARAGAAAGLLWGGAIALLADRTISEPVLDIGIRAVVVLTMTLVGAGIGWLCGCGIDAARNRCKRP